MTMKKLLMAGGAASLLLGSTAYASIIDRPFFKVLGVVVVWGADSVNGTDDAPVVSDFVLLTPAADTAGADLIAADGTTVLTGTLDAIIDTDVNVDGSTPAANPVTGGVDNGTFSDAGTIAGVLDAADTLTAFGVDANSDVGAGMVTNHESSFYVASNAAFDIYAQSSAATVTGDFVGSVDETNIELSMAVNAAGATDGALTWGANAQDPSTGGTGVAAATDLGSLSTATKVFDGGQRTAATRGTLVDQSVRFDNTYTLDDGSGLGYDLSMGSGTIYADVTYTVYVP